MNIRTAVNFFNRAYKVDAVGAFPTRIPTFTTPNYDGIIPVSSNPSFGQTADNTVHMVFYGTGASGTFQARIIFWNKLPGIYNGEVTSTIPADIWIPEVVYHVDGTLGAITGVNRSFIDGTHLFADTLSITSSTQNVAAAEILAPSGGIASLTIDMSGPQLIEIAFGLGTATGMNAIYKTY